MTKKSQTPSITSYKKLLTQFAGDLLLLKMMSQEFLDVADQYLNDIKKSILEMNAMQLKLTAHKMKGTARHFCADQVAQTSFELEMMGKSEKLESAMTSFQKLELQLNELKKELHDIVHSKAV